MFLTVFNCIIYDEKMQLVSCLSNEYLYSVLTVEEMTVIVPLIRRLMGCNTLAEFLRESHSNVDFLKTECNVSQSMIDNWTENALTEYEKYSLTFMFASLELESMRYHTCQVCGADYFAKGTRSDVCDRCAADIYNTFIADIWQSED